MARPKKDLEQIIKEKMPEFLDEVVGLSVDELNARLARLAKDNEANEQAKEDDEELEKALERLAELAAPYKDARKFIRLRSRFIIHLLKEKGADA